MIKNDKFQVEIVPGRNAVKSLAWGQLSPQDVEELANALVAMSKKLKPGKWGYIADPTKLDPIISKDTSEAFVNLHVVLDKNNCSALAFLDGRTAAMKQKTSRHHQSAGDGMVTEHFKDEKEALDWFSSIGIQ